jgi:hypothetical protein
MKKIISIIVLIVIVAGAAWAEKGKELLRVPSPMTMRQRGMGDAFTAVADDFYLLYTNPAGLAEKKNLEVKEDGGIVQIPPLNLSLGVQQDVVTNYSAAKKLVDTLSEPSQDASSISTYLNAISSFNRMNIGFMVEEVILPFGYVGENFGFNFPPTSVDLNVKPVIGLQPEVYLNLSVYSQFIIGFSPIHFDLLGEDNFHIGFGIKGMGVGLFEGSADLGKMVTWMADQDQALDYVLDNTKVGPGLGLNVGALWTLDNGLRFGLSVLDAPSVFLLADFNPAGSVQFTTDSITFAYPNLKAGVAYNLQLQKFFPDFPEWLLDNIIFSLDFSNIVDPRYRFWAKTHLGMSFNLFRTKFFGWNFSTGLNKGYWTCSTSIKLLIFHLSYAFWQDEAGIGAGDFPVGKHIVSLNLRF